MCAFNDKIYVLCVVASNDGYFYCSVVLTFVSCLFRFSKNFAERTKSTLVSALAGSRFSVQNVFTISVFLSTTDLPLNLRYDRIFLVEADFAL